MKKVINPRHKQDPVFFRDEVKTEDNDIKSQVLNHLEYSLIKDSSTVEAWDLYYALGLSLRDRLIGRWLRTQYEYRKRDVKKVYYLSMEYLIGRLLGSTLINLDLYNESYALLKELGYSLEEISELEPDMGLGNGGLGRLAACFMDSLATSAYPGYGYGIRYEFGIFKQEIEEGYQTEVPDLWRKNGCPWEIKRPEISYRVRFGGKLKTVKDEDGKTRKIWTDTSDVMAVAWDVPVPGYKVGNVNNLRLWEATATDEFDFNYFNSGDYVKAVEQKNTSENISKVLYPNDNFHLGKVLRLKQEYFFICATLQDIFYNWKQDHKGFDTMPDKIAIQLNDTHPALAIPEMMRILMDEEDMEFAPAWEITKKVFSYTNHTVLPEALERWSLKLFEELLPRHLDIIFRINDLIMKEVSARYPGDIRMMRNLSIIEEGAEKSLRMAQLCLHGSHAVNGVARLHTEILRSRVFADIEEMYPGKIQNKTNGITPRLWLLTCNPLLASLVSEHIGDGWTRDLNQLRKLENHLDDTEFCESFAEIKHMNKKSLSRYIYKELGINVSPESIFDIHIKRLHEYKRQLLTVMGVIAQYFRIKDNPEGDYVPRTVIFAGKAAPGYFLAKRIIKLINNLADIINNDEDIRDRLKLVFLPNYSVSLAEKIIPAADISKQISTAGYEASGTGNMKFALNGALTIGTMDGANVEMAEEIGEENMFIFGLRSDEVARLKQSGYDPSQYYHQSAMLRRVVDSFLDDSWCKDEPGIFAPIYDSLTTGGDTYLHLADFESFIKAQDDADKLYIDKPNWVRKAILNVARVGKFSSDRAIDEYAREIWDIQPLKLTFGD
ncbi:MAG: glycogen/starch/alpha-glucan phosphorylase [Candidatus Cloacimonadaceae bacterium]